MSNAIYAKKILARLNRRALKKLSQKYCQIKMNMILCFYNKILLKIGGN